MTSWNPPPEDNPYAQGPQPPPYGGPYPYGQPGYPPPPPNYGRGTNGMCIAGFVLAFFCSILGLIFSIVGLNQAKARQEGGQGLAIAGIVISVLGIVLGIVYFAAVYQTTGSS